MISLFNVVDHVPTPTDEAMLHACVQAIFELKYNKQPGDGQGRERKRGIAELSFVYFYTDYRSPYSQYPQDERLEVSLLAMGFEKDYKISDRLQAVIDFVLAQRDKSRKLRMLQAAQNAVDKLEVYFNSIDFQGTPDTVEEDGEGGSIVIPGKEPDDAGKVVTNLTKLGTLLKNLDQLEEQVRKDMQETSKFRGDAEPGRL